MVRPHFRLRALSAAHADAARAPAATAAAAPDIGAIEASLRNCSIARRHARGYAHHCHPHHHHNQHQQRPALGGVGAGAAEPGDDITVELNSEVPLPGNWEQVLNIQTGEIHYINRADGTKTNRDPRHRTCYAASYTSAESDPESLVYDADDNNTSSDDSSYYYNSSSSGSNRHGYDDGPESSSSSSTLSTATATGSSTASSAESSSAPAECTEAGAGAVLVLVGCRLCLTLSMVPRHGGECPKCGGTLLLRF